MASRYDFLKLCRDAGAPVRSPGRQVVVGFLGSPAFSNDDEREEWTLRAIWTAFKRKAASPVGYIVAQAQQAEVSWLSDEEEAAFQEDLQRGFGDKHWKVNVPSQDSDAVEGSADCTPRAAAAESETRAGTDGLQNRLSSRARPDQRTITSTITRPVTKVSAAEFADLCNRETAILRPLREVEAKLLPDAELVVARRRAQTVEEAFRTLPGYQETVRSVQEALLQVPHIQDAHARRSWPEGRGPVFHGGRVVVREMTKAES